MIPILQMGGGGLGVAGLGQKPGEAPFLCWTSLKAGGRLQAGAGQQGRCGGPMAGAHGRHSRRLPRTGRVIRVGLCGNVFRR